MLASTSSQTVEMLPTRQELAELLKQAEGNRQKTQEILRELESLKVNVEDVFRQPPNPTPGAAALQTVQTPPVDVSEPKWTAVVTAEERRGSWYGGAIPDRPIANSTPLDHDPNKAPLLVPVPKKPESELS